MTKQTKLPERNDILKMVQRELHEQGREDIKVEVAFVVHLDAGEPIVVNTIIDPREQFPRWKCKKFIQSILERIKDMEITEAYKQELKVLDTPSPLPEIAVQTTPNQISQAAPVIL